MTEDLTEDSSQDSDVICLDSPSKPPEPVKNHKIVDTVTSKPSSQQKRSRHNSQEIDGNMTDSNEGSGSQVIENSQNSSDFVTCTEGGRNQESSSQLGVDELLLLVEDKDDDGTDKKNGEACSLLFVLICKPRCTISYH